MLSKLFGNSEKSNDDGKSKDKGRFAEVGWLLEQETGSFIFDAPYKFEQNLPKPKSSKSVQACPSALDFDIAWFQLDQGDVLQWSR